MYCTVSDENSIVDNSISRSGLYRPVPLLLQLCHHHVDLQKTFSRHNAGHRLHKSSLRFYVQSYKVVHLGDPGQKRKQSTHYQVTTLDVCLSNSHQWDEKDTSVHHQQHPWCTNFYGLIALTEKRYNCHQVMARGMHYCVYRLLSSFSMKSLLDQHLHLLYLHCKLPLFAQHAYF